MRNLAKISLKQTSSTPSQPSAISTPQQNSTNDEKKYIIPKSLTNTFLKMPSRM
jgi:hypothetical protein